MNLEVIMKKESGIKEKQNQNRKPQPSGISENENVWNVKFKYDYNIVLGIFLFVQCHKLHHCSPHSDEKCRTKVKWEVLEFIFKFRL